MRETVFRERQEKVAHLDAVSKMIARVFGLDSYKVFGGIVADYAQEVFQETYDADLLRLKVDALRAAQGRIKSERKTAHRMLDRLERMGEFYDREFGPDLKPLAKKPPPSTPRVKKPSP